MPPKVKKTCRKELKMPSDILLEEKQIENEKENKPPEPEQKRKRNIRKLSKMQFEELKEEEELSNCFSALSQQKANIKPLGFWSKKLKDLEENIKNKKCGLYEFSSTDESEASYKRKKKPKQKAKIKKRQPAISKHFQLIEKTGKIPKPGKKTKKIHEQSMYREQIILSKERKKLAEKGAKFTFSTGMTSLGITSTPAVNKDNLVGASNFLFLSPINNEEIECCRNVDGLLAEPATNDKDPSLRHLGQETPKVETKLKRISCRRVLRSGKMLNT